MNYMKAVTKEKLLWRKYLYIAVPESNAKEDNIWEQNIQKSSPKSPVLSADARASLYRFFLSIAICSKKVLLNTYVQEIGFTGVVSSNHKRLLIERDALLNKIAKAHNIHPGNNHQLHLLSCTRLQSSVEPKKRSYLLQNGHCLVVSNILIQKWHSYALVIGSVWSFSTISMRIAGKSTSSSADGFP